MILVSREIQQGLKQVRQAEKMLSVAAKRCKSSELGDNVSVPVLDGDRGRRSDFRNISSVVTSVGQDGIYTIGTKYGVLKQSFVRSQFIPSKGSFLNIEDVLENEVTVREVARNDSRGSGQGFPNVFLSGWLYV